MARIQRFLTNLILLAIRGYQRMISPLLPPRCRFHPSCSRYTHAAIERHGLVSGSVLGIRRIARCHPWHPGGIDPVPEHLTSRTSAKRN